MIDISIVNIVVALIMALPGIYAVYRQLRKDKQDSTSLIRESAVALIEPLKKRIDELRYEIDDSRQRIISLEKALEERNERIDALEKQAHDDQGRIHELEAELEEKSKLIHALEVEINRLRRRVSKIGKDPPT